MNASGHGRAARHTGSDTNHLTLATTEPSDAGRSTARRLADGLQQVLDDAETVEVLCVATTVVIEFPESDFAVTIRTTDQPSTIRSTIAATVRAPAPDLSTWWTQWELASDESHLVTAHVGEIQAHRRRFREMVADARPELGAS